MKSRCGRPRLAEFPHGTYQRYTNFTKCRCELCLAAWSRHSKDVRKRKGDHLRAIAERERRMVAALKSVLNPMVPFSVTLDKVRAALEVNHVA